MAETLIQLQARRAALAAELAALDAVIAAATPAVVVVADADPRKLDGTFDGGGKLWEQRVPGDALPDLFATAAPGTVVRNLVGKSKWIVDAKGKDRASNVMVVDHDGCRLERPTIADWSGGGFLIRANGCTITDLTIEGAFNRYGIYGEGCRDLTIDGLRMDRGGSRGRADGTQGESIVRFGGTHRANVCTGAIRNLRINYDYGNPKQIIRGPFSGPIENFDFHGGGVPAVNVSPLGGADGGRQYLIETLYVPRLGKWLSLDAAAIRRAYAPLIARGETNPLAYRAAAADMKWTAGARAGRVSEVTEAEWTDNASRRAQQLSEYSHVEWRGGSSDGQLGGEANSWQSFDDVEFGSPTLASVFSGKHVTDAYPEDSHALPFDVRRAKPVILLGRNVRFVGKSLGIGVSFLRRSPGATGDVLLNGQPLQGIPDAA